MFFKISKLRYLNRYYSKYNSLTVHETFKSHTVGDQVEIKVIYYNN